MTDDPKTLVDRCAAAEQALATARKRVVLTQRAIDGARLEPPASTAEPSRPRATWRAGVELTALPALILGVVTSIAFPFVIDYLRRSTEAEQQRNYVGPYSASAYVERSTSPLAPPASGCSVWLTPLAPGSCNANVYCWYLTDDSTPRDSRACGDDDSIYRGQVACNEEVRVVQRDDGRSTERVVVARALDTPSSFDYDEDRQTLMVRDAEGREAFFWVAGHVGKVVR